MKVVSFLLFSTVLCAKDDLSISKGYYISGSDDNLEIICEPGHYCEEGVMYQCPAGMYNDIQGSTSIEMRWF
jgi:hypothetical protein